MPPPTTPRQSASTALRWRRTPRRLAATAAPLAMPAPQWAAQARPRQRRDGAGLRKHRQWHGRHGTGCG
nr:hypothetical protein [Xanthomonas phaseoli]